MNPIVERMVEDLTRGGEKSPLSAAQEVIDFDVNKPRMVAGVVARSTTNGKFSISPEDRVILDSVEPAGKGLVWALHIEVGDAESVHAVYIGKEGSKRTVTMTRDSIIHGDNLSVLDDGSMLLWNEDDGGGEFLMVPPVLSETIVERNLTVVPLNVRGVPAVQALKPE